MYQVLYRKWRPKTFDDVSGQPQVTQTLKNQLDAGRISHAYLFTGSRGTGKTTCAKILAKAVNCLDLKNGNPCGECEICKGIESGRILDVTEMDAASNNHVEDIKNLIDEVSYSPSEAKYRVYIVDEVHMLTKSAFNALLKTLEEPPAHVVFILATTEIHELPATIISRCQRFDFRRIDPQVIADRLMYVAQQENVTLERDAALLIAALSDGALRDALSILDRAINTDTVVTADVVRRLAGIADRDHLYRISDSIIKADADEILKIVEELHNSSMDCLRLCKELISHYRSIMLIKTMKTPRDLLIMTDDEFSKGKAIAEKMSLERITYTLNVLFLANEKILRGADSRTELELALVRLCMPQLDDNIEAVLARVSDLEQAVKYGVLSPAEQEERSEKQPEPEKDGIPGESQSPAEPVYVKRDFGKKSAPKIEDTVKSEPLPEAVTPQRPKFDAEELRRNAKPFEQWSEVLSIMNKYSKAIASAFEGTTAYVSGEYLLIDSDNDMPFLLLKQSAQRDKMRASIRQVTGKVYKLGPYKQSNTVNKSDPLEEFSENAKKLGINITTENN